MATQAADPLPPVPAAVPTFMEALLALLPAMTPQVVRAIPWAPVMACGAAYLCGFIGLHWSAIFLLLGLTAVFLALTRIEVERARAEHAAQAAEFAKSTQVARGDWVNQMVNVWWTWFIARPHINDWMVDLVQGLLDFYKPSHMPPIIVNKIIFGRRPPLLENIQLLPIKPGDDPTILNFEMDIRYTGEAKLVMATKVALIPLPLELDQITLQGRLRVSMHLNPVPEGTAPSAYSVYTDMGALPADYVEWSYFKNFKVSFLTRPVLTVNVRFLHMMNLTEMPGLSSWLKTLLTESLVDLYVAPNQYIFDIEANAKLARAEVQIVAPPTPAVESRAAGPSAGGKIPKSGSSNLLERMGFGVTSRGDADVSSSDLRRRRSGATRRRSYNDADAEPVADPTAVSPSDVTTISAALVMDAPSGPVGPTGTLAPGGRHLRADGTPTLSEEPLPSSSARVTTHPLNDSGTDPLSDSTESTPMSATATTMPDTLALPVGSPPLSTSPASASTAAAQPQRMPVPRPKQPAQDAAAVQEKKGLFGALRRTFTRTKSSSGNGTPTGAAGDAADDAEPSMVDLVREDLTLLEEGEFENIKNTYRAAEALDPKAPDYAENMRRLQTDVEDSGVTIDQRLQACESMLEEANASSQRSAVNGLKKQIDKLKQANRKLFEQKFNATFKKKVV